METKLNHKLIGSCCHATAGVQFMLIGLNEELRKNGGDISKLNLTQDGEPIMGEGEFNEMLMAVVGSKFDEKRITADERATLNSISAYLVSKRQ